MVDTKKQLSDKVVIGILVGGFSFLIVSISNGMAMWTAIWWTVGIVAAGFICAVLGVEKVSATTIVSALAKILQILSDKNKDPSAKILEAQLVIKQDLEMWNDIWNALVVKANAQPKAVQDAAKQALDELNPPTPPTQ